MYMFILCFRQIFPTEQVPATKIWFYAILFKMPNMAACSACKTVISVKISNVKKKIQEGDKFYWLILAKSINTCTWNMTTEALDCMKHIGVCRKCI